MGAGAGASQNGDDDANKTTLTPPQDTTILDNVTKPIVKVLGELFSREDKKSIPTFKGEKCRQINHRMVKNSRTRSKK